MKKFIKNLSVVIGCFTLVVTTSCQDNLLDTDIDPLNDNEPTLSAIATAEDLSRVAQGIYGPLADPDLNSNPSNPSYYLWFVYGYHETMGDVMTMPWGNFGGRWVNQTESILLDGGVLTANGNATTVIDNGTTVLPPEGGLQGDEIARLNDRAQGNGNPVQWEWAHLYALNTQTNLIIAGADAIELSAAQSQAFRAWALLWKAFAYHRIGSMYETGLIVNTDPNVEATNSNFVSQAEIIAESNRVLAELSTLLSSVSDVTTFNSLIDNFQIDVFNSTVDFDGILANIATLQARNLVYNTPVSEMTTADWNNVITWTNSGILDNSDAFIAQSEDTFINNNWLSAQVFGFWYFPSNRLIQDINDGDARLDSYFNSTTDDINANPRGRGIQYGATHFWKAESAIADTSVGATSMYFSGSHEENRLLRAEALARTGNVEGALADLDAVRTLQNSSLAATVGTGLTAADALEEIRKERRIALLFRGLSFYDARRYGVSNGTRTGAHVLNAAGDVLYENSTITYTYLDYWPVPTNESDFNSPPGALE